MYTEKKFSEVVRKNAYFEKDRIGVCITVLADMPSSRKVIE